MAKKKTISKGLRKKNEEAFKKAWQKEHEYCQKTLKKYLKGDHKKPASRREFLSAGLISSSAMMLGPSLASLIALPEKANAAECPVADAVNGPAAFCHFHAAGGIHTLAMSTPRRSLNGAEISNNGFRSLGLGNNPNFVQLFANDARFVTGLPAGQGLTNGIQDSCQASTRSNAIWVITTCRDNGDSRDPEKSLIGLVERLGRAGANLGFTGTDNSGTGSGNAPNFAFNIASNQPLRVRNPNDILNAVQLSGALQNLSSNQQQSLARLIQGLSNSQAQKLTGLGGGQNLAFAVECATGQNLKNVVEGGGGLDTPDAVRNIWNNFQDENVEVNGGGSRSRLENDVAGSMNYNAIAGNSAGSVYQMGSCDIHNDSDADGGRGVQERRAYLVGLWVGRTLETARLLNRKVVLHITTNGSNNNNGGTLNSRFNSDSSNYSGSHMIFYDPAGAPQTVGGLNAQIGGLRDDGSTDRNLFTSDPVQHLLAQFYNYCIFSGDEAGFDRVLGGNTLSAARKTEVRRIA